MRINLITDEGSVSKKDHTALKEELEKVGYSIKEKRSDMGAKGGYHWFPVGLVLYVAVEFLGGFSKRMGQRFADAILKLIENIKNRGHYQKPEVCLQTNLKMDYGKLIVYFVFDREQEYTYTDIQTALKTVYKSCEDLQELLIKNPHKLTGRPATAILKFDTKTQKWNIEALLKDLNNDYSI